MKSAPLVRPSFAVRSSAGYANAALPRRADPASLQELAGRTMGTTWSLRFDNPRMLSRDSVDASVRAALERVVAQMSTWVAASDISRFNRADAGSRHVLAPEFAEVLACALHWAEASGGAIDPTIGPLVALWGFGAHAAVSVRAPSAAALDAARGRVGWERVAFDPTAASLLNPGGVELDLSGIAKGFAVDHVTTCLQALGLEDFLIEIGGELRGAGRRPDGRAWQVRIDAAPETLQNVTLDDHAIATSGERWHWHESEGRRWSHTIDPRSGEPVDHALASVTVLHRQCMHADALATVLSVLGPRAGHAFAQRHGVAALFVFREGAAQRALTSDAWPTQTT